MLRKYCLLIPLSCIICALYTTALRAGQPPAEAAAPSQQQLLDLISGNSTEGLWAGRPYQQYFSASGSTNYQEAGARPSTGRWRVNAGGQYCSVWPPSSQETCYNLLVLGKDLYWQSGDTYYKASVLEGNIFLQ